MTREEIEKKAEGLAKTIGHPDGSFWNPEQTLIEMAEWSASKFLEFAEANAFPVRGYVHKAVTLDVLRSYFEGKE